MKTLDDFVGNYGWDWTTGVLTDHLGDAEAAGMLVHTSSRGFAFVTGPKGGKAVPVLCGEIIDMPTEDGPGTGRCGLPAKDGELGCPGHHEVIMSYRSDYDHLYEWETV